MDWSHFHVFPTGLVNGLLDQFALLCYAIPSLDLPGEGLDSNHVDKKTPKKMVQLLPVA
jgi:hypothetical protein